jgi:hypothetical protein
MVLGADHALAKVGSEWIEIICHVINALAKP